MAGFYYPIKVIQKKISSAGYRPFAVDCTDGTQLKLDNNKKSYFKHLSLQVLCLLISLAVLHFVVLDPLIKTSSSRSIVAESLANMGESDSNIVSKLRDMGTVVSENTDSGIVNLVIAIDRATMKESLELAFSLTTLKEVATDDKTISVTFLSSAK